MSIHTDLRKGVDRSVWNSEQHRFIRSSWVPDVQQENVLRMINQDHSCLPHAPWKGIHIQNTVQFRADCGSLRAAKLLEGYHSGQV